MATLAHVKLVFGLPAGNKMTCGLDFESNLALTLANIDEMADRARDEWTSGTTAQSLYTDGMYLDHTEAFAYDIVPDPTGPPPFKRQMVLGPVAKSSLAFGSRALEGGSPNLSPVVTFRTLLSSRRTRGRIYTPPVQRDGVNEAGVITAAVLGDLRTVWPSWITAIENSATVPQTYTHVVISLTGNLVTPVVTYQVKQRVDTQRRRLARAADV